MPTADHKQLQHIHAMGFIASNQTSRKFKNILTMF
jgi:hypothetical protein